MLTEENLQEIEELASKMGGTGISTVKELISNIRTLQQQNRDLSDELSNANEANRIVVDINDKVEQQNKQLVEALDRLISIVEPHYPITAADYRIWLQTIRGE